MPPNKENKVSNNSKDGSNRSFLNYRKYFKEQNKNVLPRDMYQQTCRKWRLLSKSEKNLFSKENFDKDLDLKIILCEPVVDESEERNVALEAPPSDPVNTGVDTEEDQTAASVLEDAAGSVQQEDPVAVTGNEPKPRGMSCTVQ